MENQFENKPKTELRLEELQTKYLANRSDTAVFQEFLLLLKSYAKSLTLKKLKTKIYLDIDHVDGIATEAALKVLDQYKKPGWKVWGSFAGILNYKIMEALYGDYLEDTAQSLNLLIGDSSPHELEDALSSIGFTPIWQQEIGNPQERCFKILDSAPSEIQGILKESEEVLTPSQVILLYSYVLLRLRRPKIRFVMNSFKERFLTPKEEEVFELILLEIRNRLVIHTL